MKKVLFFLFYIMVFQGHAQLKTDKIFPENLDEVTTKKQDVTHVIPPTEYKKIMLDTIPQVIYINNSQKTSEFDDKKTAALFLDDVPLNPDLLSKINPEYIKNFTIERNNDTIIDNTTYNGIIHIELKDGFKPNFITLNQLKKKYLHNEEAPVLFSINNELIINEDYDKCLIDEYFVYKITVQKIENEKENIKMNLVNIITKTRENIAKDNNFWRKGTTNF